MNPAALLRFANMSLLLCLFGGGGTVVLAYGFYQGLSLGAQISAHVALVLIATVLKLSYIARLVALKQLGRPLH